MDIWELIQRRFPKEEYALLREVRNAAGYNATRSADAIAFNLWPSRGLEINGEEFDYDEPITFEEAITDILTECDRINKVYPEEHCVINKNDLVLAS